MVHRQDQRQRYRELRSRGIVDTFRTLPQAAFSGSA
jgi:hypothetical protein